MQTPTVSLTALALLVATACYLGFQWTVRVLVYPQFTGVGPSEFAAYERAHQRRVSWAVGPLFIVLLATSAAVTLQPPAGPPRWLPWMADALTGLILVVTALGAVPQHRRLTLGFDGDAHRRLLGVDTVRLLIAGANVAVALALVCQSAG